ncbi:MAG: hypothetical protein IJK88_05485 [Clostridia bacterium]|nr:hypothetical protein [Clostridia bacterium]
MSTDRKRKKKRAIVRIERIKIIEYVFIGLVILLFCAMALYYGNGCSRKGRYADVEATASPVPTDDPSIRGMNVFSALEANGFTVTLQGDSYTVTAPNEVVFTMRMQSDDKGIMTLSFETPCCPDPEEEGAVYDALRRENRRTVDALRELFDCIMPVFRRPMSDGETIVQQCAKVVEKGNSYAKRLGDYSVRILSDPDAIPQTVSITLMRDK